MCTVLYNLTLYNPYFTRYCGSIWYSLPQPKGHLQGVMGEWIWVSDPTVH